MLAPYGGLVTGPAASNWYRTTAGRSAYGPVALNHRGGDAGHTGTICPPTPAQSGASKAASKPRSQPRSNVTSSSVNASTRRPLCDGRPRAVRGFVVHDEQLPIQPGGHIQLRQTLERPTEPGRPVMGAKDDGEVHFRDPAEMGQRARRRARIVSRRGTPRGCSPWPAGIP